VSAFQIVEKGYFLGNFFVRTSIFNIRLSMQWDLLISAPGASLSAGRAVSLLCAKAPAGSHLSRYSRRSLRTFRSNQQGANQPIDLQHTLPNLENCVAIMFWQAPVRRACSLTFFTSLNWHITSINII
jgi:hypothetical protein